MVDTILVRNSFSSSTAKVLIYDPDGRPVKTTRANARDLVGQCGYTWNPTKKDGSGEEDAADAEPAASPTVQSLEEIARTVAGEDNVESYLRGYSPAALRDLLEQRYAIQADKRKGKETLIKEIMELEEERLDSIPAWKVDYENEAEDEQALEDEEDEEKVVSDEVDED